MYATMIRTIRAKKYLKKKGYVVLKETTFMKRLKEAHKFGIQIGYEQGSMEPQRPPHTI